MDHGRLVRKVRENVRETLIVWDAMSNVLTRAKLALAFDIVWDWLSHHYHAELPFLFDS